MVGRSGLALVGDVSSIPVSLPPLHSVPPRRPPPPTLKPASHTHWPMLEKEET